MKRYLNYVIRYCFNLLPQSFRVRLIRNKFWIPETTWDQRYTIKIADTQEELEEAYRLLHDSYVSMKLMDKQPHGLRCNIYTFLPYTTTLIAKYGREIVGTVTLIKDSQIGLPSDHDYKKENDVYRCQNFKLVEVSALAISEKFRNKGHSASLLLMKYLYNYSGYYMDASMLICAVHPRAEDFYKALFGFEKNGKVIKYDFAKGALAIHLSLGFKDKKLHEEMVAEFFRNNPKYSQPSDPFPERSLKLFWMATDKRFVYPSRREEQVVDPIWNPQLLEYFLFEKTQVYKDFDDESKITFIQIYRHIFDVSALSRIFKIDDLCRYREFRFPISLTAAMSVNGNVMIGKLIDITSEGCFFEFNADISAEEKIELLFRLDGKLHKAVASIVWRNENKQNSRYPFGYGMKFNKSIDEISTLQKSWLSADSASGHDSVAKPLVRKA